MAQKVYGCRGSSRDVEVHVERRKAVVDKETHLEMAGTASLSVSVLLISGLAVPAVLFLPLHISQHLHPDRSKLIDDRPNSSPEVQSP